MSSNEKERPVASGLEEIFGGSAAPASTEIAPVNEPTAESSAGGEQGQQNRHGDRNRRRKGRRPKGKRPEYTRDAGDAEDVSDANDADETVINDDEAPAAPDMNENQDASPAEAPDDEIISENESFTGDDAESDQPDDELGYTEVTVTTSAPETVEVVGIRFKDTSKTYYFAPGDAAFRQGEHVIVETARGMEYGTVSVANTTVPVSVIVPPLRDVLRPATDEDTAKHEENLAKAKDAFTVCLGKIHDHGLEMKLIDAEYTFDQSKLTFYFSADGRVDFRELVKDLASVFRTRIELRQIGIRDEAKLVGGLGVCGRPFCCSTFLSDFVQVSIKMAKEQNLSLNSAKISGACGRLMCCLRYEHETYAEEIKKTPSVGSRVKTADGTGVVIETSPLRAKVKVRIGDDGNHNIHEYNRDDVTVLPKNKPEN